MYPGYSDAAPSGVSQCVSPLTSGLAVVRCCRDACANDACNYTDCVAPNPDADPRPPLYTGGSNDACGTDTPNGDIENGICVCEKGANAEECAGLGTAVGAQSEGGAGGCLIVDCGGRGLTSLPTFPYGTTKLDLQKNPMLTPVNIGALGSSREFDDLAVTTWLYVQNVPISDIAAFAFSNMISLATLEISHTNLISINKEAFNGLIALKTLTFADNKYMTTIIPGALREASNLKSITFTSLPAFEFVSRGFQQMRNLETFTANNCAGITSIPSRLFEGSESLKSITFEFNENLASIESGAFGGATSVEELRLIELAKLTRLNSATSDPFNGLSGLKTLTIKNGVGNGGLTAVQSSDFKGLTALENVELDIAALVLLGEGIFTGMRKLKTVIISGAAGMGSLPSTLFAGVQATVEDISLAGLGIESSHLNGLFDGLTRLQSLEISCCQAVTTIAKGQFYDCTSLEKMAISNNGALTSIEPGAFTNLKKLQHLDVAGNMMLARFESGTFDHAFDDEASSIVINLEGNGIRAMSPRAVNFDADGAPSQTIVVISSAAGTSLDACCAFEWMKLDTHYVTNGLKCNNAKPHEDRATGSVYDLTAAETEFGCCLSKYAGPNWDKEVKSLHDTAINSEVVVGSYENLKDDTKEYLEKFCKQSTWSAATKLDDNDPRQSCDTPADCPPGLMDFFQQKYVPSHETCGAAFDHLESKEGAEEHGPNGDAMAKRECPDGSRIENNGMRYLLDCEPWVHEAREYVTRHVVAEQQCVDCVVQNCLTCDENYRRCDECDHQHSLYIDKETNVHSCVLTEECPGDMFSTNAAEDRVHECKDWDICEKGQEETVAPTKLTDRTCAPINITAAVAASVAPVLFIAFCIIYYMRWRTNKLVKEKLKAHDFLATIQSMLAEGDLDRAHADAQMVPREIKRAHITLSKVLGQGAFGEVKKGEIDESSAGGAPGYACAVKTVKAGSAEGLLDLLQEATVMAHVGSHSHIVSIIGVVTSGEPAMLVISLCEHGSLKDVLSKAHDDDVPVEPLEKNRICVEIAEGMSYLHSKRFVHRDLAARNVLVASGMTAKVADFGLSRAMAGAGASGEGDGDGDGDGGADYYRSHRGVFPVRWTAIEAMETLVFNAATDVWSFGIVMDEVWWDAQLKPYGLMKNKEVMGMLKQGGRLLKPANASDGIYQIMLACWKEDPAERPSFVQLVGLLRPHTIAVRDLQYDRAAPTSTSAVGLRNMQVAATASTPASSVLGAGPAYKLEGRSECEIEVVLADELDEDGYQRPAASSSSTSVAGSRIAIQGGAAGALDADGEDEYLAVSVAGSRIEIQGGAAGALDADGEDEYLAVMIGLQNAAVAGFATEAGEGVEDGVEEYDSDSEWEC